MSPVSFADPRVESYLRRLTLPLERTVDAEHLHEIRESALFHLECLMEEFAEAPDPVQEALKEFGEPDLTALGMLDEWSRGRAASTFTRCSSGAVWWSFVAFGAAAALSAFLVVAASMWPGGADLAPICIAFVWAAPVVAGAVTGYLVPTGNLKALLWAWAPLVVFAWILATAMAPQEAGYAFAAVLTAAWPLLGAGSLALTAWLRRNRPNRYRVIPSNGVRS